MNNNEKCLLLKDTIETLFSKEGRSYSYISRLLKIDRKTLTNNIKNWGLKKANISYMTPSNQKFVNKHRTLIKSKLDNNISISQIAKELNTSRDFLQKIVLKKDEVLKKAHEDYINRMKEQFDANKSIYMEKSSMDYDIKDYDNEIWKPIMGYSLYMVSNYGRIKKYCKRYNNYFLLKPYENQNTHRLYIKIVNDEGESKNLQISRIVANTFLLKPSEDANTVNHIDGDIKNNKVENLEWVTQSDNNKHSYLFLNRQVNKNNKSRFKKIIYKNNYEFKTVAAFSRFLNKSETQTRRYLENPKKHEIQIIK